MGSRKTKMADAMKEARKTQYFAKLNNCPTSPRKMRLVADIIRGKNVTEALNILKFTQKEAAGRMEKLLMSAVNNWEQKTEGAGGDIEDLYVKSVTVDSARMLKRIQPAPQGRAHRIRKRSNHVTLFVDIKN